MNQFIKRLNLGDVHLNLNEKNELNQALLNIDFRRVEVISIVTIVVCSALIVLNPFLFNDKYLISYLISDAILLLLSSSIFLNTIIIKKNLNKFKSIVVKTYPGILLLWVTLFVSLDRDFLLNIGGYYLIFFLIAFAIVIPIRLLIAYFILTLVEFIFVSYLIGNNPFNEVISLMVIGGLLALPLFFTFKSLRYNTLATNIRLNNSNKSLESEVNIKYRELKSLNEDLQNEITHRKLVEEKLRKALEMAESSDQLKSEFLANISHEIRTPLNAIIGFTELLTEDELDKKTSTEFKDLISSNTMYLLATIDDIFDASIIKTNQVNAIYKPFKVNAFLESVEYEATGIAIKHNRPNIKFEVFRIDDNDFRIVNDQFYLKKALLRLIDNAFKFTKYGKVSVGAVIQEKEISFYVKDTGIGIEKTDFSKIFEPFVQGDGSFTRGYGGSGLGLSIVSGIIQELGGRINFDTELNKGSRFAINIDITPNLQP